MESKIKILKDIFYFKDQMLHREDGPAIEFNNGCQFWFINGKLHRDNGPAIVDNDELMQYWLNGEPATEEEIINIKRNNLIDNII
jgi:hypothetical protein